MGFKGRDIIYIIIYLKVNFIGKLIVYVFIVVWFFVKVYMLSNCMICIYIVLKVRDYILK